MQQFSLRLLRKSHLLMIDNQQLTEDLVKKGINKNLISVQPGGVDLNQFKQIKPDPSFYSDALFVGRLQPHKGVFDTIQIWQKVTQKITQAQLIILGHGPNQVVKNLRDEIHKANLGQKIKIISYIYDRQKFLKYFKGTKMLLFLDHEAGFGLVVAEAMAAGLPVIAYNLPIFGTVYQKGFLTASLEDTSTISSYIINLLNSSEKYSKLSQEAYKESVKFDWSNVSRRFYKTLSDYGAPRLKP